MMAAILAAGGGERMLPLSNQHPKPMLPICNKPLLQHQIELVRELGVEEVLVVIGHLGYDLASNLGDGRDLGVRIRYVEQTKRLGIAHALGRLEPYVDAPLLLLLGDIFFVAPELKSMAAILHERRADAVLAVKQEHAPAALKKNFAVYVEEDGRVSKVIEKPRRPATTLKGCGLYLFDVGVFDAVRRTPRTAMRDEYEITDSIQIMIDNGAAVYAAEVVESDLNLTNPKDLLECNLLQLRQMQRHELRGESSQIHPRAELVNCVVGDRVRVEHPIRISNCLIFSDVTVTSEHDIDGFILTPEHQIECREGS